MRYACLYLAIAVSLLCLPVLASAQDSTHGRLFVESNADNPVISILNHELTFIQGMPLKPGMYVVQVSAEGYPAKTKTVQVVAGKDVRLRVNLAREEKPEEAAPAAPPTDGKPVHEKREKGSSRLFVKATPDDATVRILNIAPKFKQGMELKPGAYEVEVKKAGVGEIVRNVQLRKNEDLTLTVNLKADEPDKKDADEPAKQQAQQPGRLYVKTSPKDATVKLLGIDPVFKQGIRLKPGTYRIAVNREGYQESELEAEVYSGKDTRVSITLISDTPTPEDFPPARLEDDKTVTAPAGKAEERLYVITVPENASIRILNIVPKFEQGIEVGDGEYEVEVSHGDYETQVRMVTVPDNKHLAVGFDLRPPEQRLREDKKDEQPDAKTPAISDPSKGQLFVETDVEDVRINLMDLKQPFEQGMELSPGSYRIEVLKEGVGRKEAMAVVSSGKASHLKVLLNPAPLPPEVVELEKLKQRRKELMDKAAQARNADKPEEALQLVNQAIEIDPRYGGAYTMRGNLFFARGDFEKALQDYNKAIELAPNAPAAWLARGKTHALLEDPKSACYDFWKACAMERCEGIAAAKKEGLCR